MLDPDFDGKALLQILKFFWNVTLLILIKYAFSSAWHLIAWLHNELILRFPLESWSNWATINGVDGMLDVVTALMILTYFFPRKSKSQ